MKKKRVKPMFSLKKNVNTKVELRTTTNESRAKMSLATDPFAIALKALLVLVMDLTSPGNFMYDVASNVERLAKEKRLL